tara:strand:- start:1811 stop:2065 length:255 start_codon:yes stop_codon:yes gene_type:complete
MKALGYFVSLIGVLVLATSVPPVKKFVISFLPSLSGVHNFVIIGLGVLILVIGVVMLRRSVGSGKVKELPIYHGKDVVGYRRTK